MKMAKQDRKQFKIMKEYFYISLLIYWKPWSLNIKTPWRLGTQKEKIVVWSLHNLKFIKVI